MTAPFAETAPRIGSLCSGTGALDMGLMSVVGGTVAWHAEIDPGASRILAHHWPDVPNLGDLTTIDWSGVEPVDWLTAGYPCPPFSLAGKRKGFDDDRYIWPWIADAIRALRPRNVLLENVSGHVGLGLDRTLADLAAFGFDAEWEVVRASDVGAAHQRARVFIVATDTDRDPVRVQPVAVTWGCGQAVVERVGRGATTAHAGRVHGEPGGGAAKW